MGPPSGTGVGARGISCRWLPTTFSLLLMGRKDRMDPDVPAATRRDSWPPATKGFGAAFLTWVVLALFLAGGPSSPSVPSSYPEVLPSFCFFRGRPRGRPVGCLFLEFLLEGREDG